MDIGIIWWEFEDSAEHLSCSVHVTALSEPTWRFGDAEDEEDDYDGKDELDGDRRPPCSVRLDVGEAVVHPVGEHNTDTDEPNLPADHSTTPFTLDELTLVHGHCGAIDTRSEASDDTSHDEMSQCECAGLQGGTDDDQTHGEPDHLSTTEHVADEEVEDASEEGA